MLLNGNPAHAGIMSFEDHDFLSHMFRGQFGIAASALGWMAGMHRIAARVMAPTLLGDAVQRISNIEDAAAQFLTHLGKDVKRIPLNFDGLIINGDPVTVTEHRVYETPFGHLTHLSRMHPDGAPLTRRDPPLVVFVPHSGHRASLLQDTIATLIPDHDVYYVEMNSANDIPVSAGSFDYHDHIDFSRAAIEAAGKHSAARGGPRRVHVMAVCQPGPPVFIAAMTMAKDKRPYRPRSFAALASPFDTRINPTAVNEFARGHSMEWFEQNVIHRVPARYAGAGRRAYPDYIQRAAFVAKSADEHVKHMKRLFDNLAAGNDNAALKKMKFDDVFFFDIASLPAEFYLQTVKYNFKEDHLPRGLFDHRGVRITGAENTDIVMIAIEGGKDDVTGLGQTRAVHDLCSRLPESKKHHLVIPDAGHYSVFSGKWFRENISHWLKNQVRNADKNTYNSPVNQPVLRVV